LVVVTKICAAFHYSNMGDDTEHKVELVRVPR
jgi:hypothetical protein